MVQRRAEHIFFPGEETQRDTPRSRFRREHGKEWDIVILELILGPCLTLTSYARILDHGVLFSHVTRFPPKSCVPWNLEQPRVQDMFKLKKQGNKFVGCIRGSGRRALAGAKNLMLMRTNAAILIPVPSSCSSAGREY